MGEFKWSGFSSVVVGLWSLASLKGCGVPGQIPFGSALGTLSPGEYAGTFGMTPKPEQTIVLPDKTFLGELAAQFSMLEPIGWYLYFFPSK